jgi:large subunit ribosomal protein L9
VTEENKRQIARERVKADQKDAEEVIAARALADKLGALELAIPRRVGENDILFGSVTSGDLADLLASRDLQVDKRKIMLTEALKSVGEHTGVIKLHRDVQAELKVKIVPAEG